MWPNTEPYERQISRKVIITHSSFIREQSIRMSVRSIKCSRCAQAGSAFGCAAICTLALTLLGSPRQAQAEFFQYSSTISLTNVVNPPTTLLGNGTGSVAMTSALGTVFNLTAANSIGPDNIDGSGLGSDIVYVNISAAVSAATPLETISFDYTFNLNIDDYGLSPTLGPIQGSSVFTIKGTLVETVGAGKKITLLSNTFTSPPTQSQIIAGQQYTVSLYSLVPPGASNAGVFGLHVSPVPIPEPGTFALLSMGIVSLAIPAVRRWRRRA
jgi:hypothetical protein